MRKIEPGRTELLRRPVGYDVQFRVGNEDFTDFARQTLAYIRGTRSWRLSAL
jgi:hypothetical protein